MAFLSVIVGRFQTSELTSGHRRLILRALDANPAKHLMVFVGSAGKVPSVSNPLSYEIRAAMVEEFVQRASPSTKLTILPVLDNQSDQLWMQSIGTLVQSYVSAHGMSHATYFSDPEGFIKYVRPTQGLIMEVTPEKTNIRATVYRENIAKTPSLDSGEFRRGAIWATQNQYPIVSPTVDIACIDPSTGYVAMIKKEGENLWRFPGGFVDVEDASLTDAAKRELLEECNLKGGDWKYRGSQKINDWRLRGEAKRGIMTTLFQCYLTSGELKAGDDAHTAGWMSLRLLNDMDVMPEHRPLVRLQRMV